MNYKNDLYTKEVEFFLVAGNVFLSALTRVLKFKIYTELGAEKGLNGTDIGLVK